MGFINLAEKTVHAKLVYYGIGSGGKTTSLQAVHGIMCPSNEVKLVSINTEQDATLLFDFLPIDLGRVENYKIVIQGFTVPGQPKYKRMRKYVLQGADAVVLVVDSQRSRLEENIEALEGLLENLASNGLDPDTIPLVMQYNKRDLEDILPESELNEHFLVRDDVQSFPSVATESQGVYETFVHAAGLLVETKIKQYDLGKGKVDPRKVAEAARSKLWTLYDEFRSHTEQQVEGREVLEVTVDEDDNRKGEPKVRATTSVVRDHPKPSAMEQIEAAPVAADETHDNLEVFSDEDLDLELTSPGPLSIDPEMPLRDEGDEGLLDKALVSNLHLAEAFGELDQLKAGLQRRNEELVKTAQNSVHDLNKPLAAIKLMLSSAAKGYLGEVNGKLAGGIDNALQAVAMMERLIGDLSDSMLLDSAISLQFTDVDLAVLCADVVRTQRFLIEERDVGVRIEPLPVIRADAWALTKAFMNLLGNAIQYAAPDRSPRIWVSYRDLGDEHRIEFRDNGIGIPEGEGERLFQRFARGSNAAGISGTGLGLHIVHEAVLGHGGRVELESTEGVGTTFVLILPKEPVHVPASPVTVGSTV